jgi:hypothetical protein
VAVLLAVNTAHWLQSDLGRLRTPRRFWEDTGVAISRTLADPAQPGTLDLESWPAPERLRAYQRRIVAGVAGEGVRPWQFWRTVSMARFRGQEVLTARPSDDAGRAALLTAGYRLLGGPAPYLLPWLGALLALPLLCWLSVELGRAGAPLAGVAFGALFACSAYAVETLALPYSAVGFYLAATVALAALSAHASLGPVSPGGLAGRALLAGSVLALSAWCRAGAILLVPGFLLALFLGACRAVPPRGSLAARLPHLRATGFALLLGAAFLAPYVALAPPRGHEAWLGIWEGLGDFDRSRGHYWNDDHAKAVLRGAGFEAPPHEPVWKHAMRHEAFFRDLVLTGLVEGPAWYAGILIRRLWATVSLAKLRPYRQTDGQTFAPKTSAQEGAMDTYWRMTATVDVFGLGRSRREVRVGLLPLPTLLLVAAWLWRRFGAARPSWSASAGARLRVLLPVALGSLVSPVLITTASGLEPQAFALTYFLGAALLADLALRGRGRPARV